MQRGPSKNMLASITIHGRMRSTIRRRTCRAGPARCSAANLSEAICATLEVNAGIGGRGRNLVVKI
jgi:hypothetical protein